MVNQHRVNEWLLGRLTETAQLLLAVLEVINKVDHQIKIEVKRVAIARTIILIVCTVKTQIHTDVPRLVQTDSHLHARMTRDIPATFLIHRIIGLFGIGRHIPQRQLVIKRKGLDAASSKDEVPCDWTLHLIAEKGVGDVDHSRQRSRQELEIVASIAIHLRHSIRSRLTASRHLRIDASAGLNTKDWREIMSKHTAKGRHLVEDEVCGIRILRHRLTKSTSNTHIPVAMLMFRGIIQLSRCRQCTCQQTHRPNRLNPCFRKLHFFVIFRVLLAKVPQKSKIQTKIGNKIKNIDKIP